jgi:hypothetical protein
MVAMRVHFRPSDPAAGKLVKKSLVEGTVSAAGPDRGVGVPFNALLPADPDRTNGAHI